MRDLTVGRKLKLNLIRIPAISTGNLPETYNTPAVVAACWFSHQLAMTQFLKSQFSHALILEDDAIFKKGFENVIDSFVENVCLFQKYEMIQIGYLVNKLNLMDSGTLDLFQIMYFKYFHKYFKTSNSFKIGGHIYLENAIEAGAHGYIVNRLGAEKLCKINRMADMSTDLLYIKLGNCKSLNSIRLIGSVISQSGSLSSINQRNQDVKSYPEVVDNSNPKNLKIDSIKLDQIRDKYKINYKVISSEFAFISTDQTIDLSSYSMKKQVKNLDFFQVYYVRPRIFSKLANKKVFFEFKFRVKLFLSLFVNKLLEFRTIDTRFCKRMKNFKYTQAKLDNFRKDLELSNRILKHDFIPTKSVVLISIDYLIRICEFNSLGFFDMNNLLHGMSRAANSNNYRIV